MENHPCRHLAFRSIALGLLTAAMAWAHHSTAAFDMKHEFTLRGTVTEFRWMNPHSEIFVDAADDEGVIHRWELEAESLNLLRRNGWSKTSLKAGDQISCLGARAKDPASYSMKCFVVTFADGRKLVATPTSVPIK
jgi:hypothetical protein